MLRRGDPRQHACPQRRIVTTPARRRTPDMRANRETVTTQQFIDEMNKNLENFNDEHSKKLSIWRESGLRAPQELIGIVLPGYMDEIVDTDSELEHSTVDPESLEEMVQLYETVTRDLAGLDRILSNGGASESGIDETLARQEETLETEARELRDLYHIGQDRAKSDEDSLSQSGGMFETDSAEDDEIAPQNRTREAYRNFVGIGLVETNQPNNIDANNHIDERNNANNENVQNAEHDDFDGIFSDDSNASIDSYESMEQDSRSSSRAIDFEMRHEQHNLDIDMAYHGQILQMLQFNATVNWNSRRDFFRKFPPYKYSIAARQITENLIGQGVDTTVTPLVLAAELLKIGRDGGANYEIPLINPAEIVDEDNDMTLPWNVRRLAGGEMDLLEEAFLRQEYDRFREQMPILNGPPEPGILRGPINVSFRQELHWRRWKTAHVLEWLRTIFGRDHEILATFMEASVEGKDFVQLIMQNDWENFDPSVPVEDRQRIAEAFEEVREERNRILENRLQEADENQMI
ncbi:unnamed protein product [Caenorhabditis sp. 36 PRJEB53466]|nr:unnamed protein product [Caenorhabditis sp. 36 PRJEB53466]